MIEPNTVYFVGSGPGDPELITLKAKKLLEIADVVVYSGSLLNPKLLEYAKKDAVLHDAALIDRNKIYEILRDSTKQGKLAIRFHDGDPALFSTIREQLINWIQTAYVVKCSRNNRHLRCGLFTKFRINSSWNYSNSYYYEGRA